MSASFVRELKVDQLISQYGLDAIIKVEEGLLANYFVKPLNTKNFKNWDSVNSFLYYFQHFKTSAQREGQ